MPDLEPTALADAYDGRAMIEATFCQDKQALGLVKQIFPPPFSRIHL
jgi:hypothetical protein